MTRPVNSDNVLVLSFSAYDPLAAFYGDHLYIVRERNLSYPIFVLTATCYTMVIVVYA